MHIQAALNAPDRSAEDKRDDANRRPGLLLAFAGIQPGMKVGELVAGEGYTAELLARTVGPTGQVLAENPKVLRDGPFGAVMNKRLEKPVNKVIQKQDTETDAPFPAGTQLDVVTLILNYHDLIWAGADRPKANAAVFAALKPGGAYIVVDASAAKGAGGTVAQKLHRVEESLVIKEITAAGFKLAEQGDFMRNPADKLDGSSLAGDSAARAKVDRFVLKFVKP
jgi:predicted methyltransferase